MNMYNMYISWLSVLPSFVETRTFRKSFVQWIDPQRTQKEIWLGVGNWPRELYKWLGLDSTINQTEPHIFHSFRIYKNYPIQARGPDIVIENKEKMCQPVNESITADRGINLKVW